MLPFNLILNEMIRNAKSKHFEPLEKEEKYPDMPLAGKIKKIVKKLDRCPKCHFLIFDNYWMGEIENKKMKVCTTCGERV